MAKRPVFYAENDIIKSTNVEFQWYPGFAVSQKQKSINALHEALLTIRPDAKPLEISSKSAVPLGAKLSAFNLKLNGYYLECVFQSSKVFDDTGVPHTEWLDLSPKEAKKEARNLHDSGCRLTSFRFNGIDYPLEPRTCFYDYIYYLSVRETMTDDELKELTEYDHFTDIEFSPEKSLNTQARSVVMIKLIFEKHGKLPEFSCDEYIDLYRKYIPVV